MGVELLGKMNELTTVKPILKQYDCLRIQTDCHVFVSCASCMLRGTTQVVTFLSVRYKKNGGKDRKGNAF